MKGVKLGKYVFICARYNKDGYNLWFKTYRTKIGGLAALGKWMWQNRSDQGWIRSHNPFKVNEYEIFNVEYVAKNEIFTMHCFVLD